MPCASRSPSPAAVSPYWSATAPCALRATTTTGPTILTWRSDMKASTFALVFGIAYLAAGLLGLIPAALMPPPVDAPPTRFAMMYGYLLGLFPVNIVHTGLHLAIGAWGLAAWLGRASAVRYARALAVLYGVLAVMGMLPLLNTTFGFIPLHSHDIWLHAVTALVAAHVGWRAPARGWGGWPPRMRAAAAPPRSASAGTPVSTGASAWCRWRTSGVSVWPTGGSTSTARRPPCGGTCASPAAAPPSHRGRWRAAAACGRASCPSR